MISQYWWVPITIVMYIVIAILSKNAADVSGMKNKWFYLLFVVQMFPLWALVAAYSKPKDLLFNGLLYDLLMFSSYTFCLILLGSAAKFTTLQWIGMMLAVSGYILIKFGEFKGA